MYDVWDTARVVDTEETYEQRVHFFHLSLQILKVVTYIVLGVVVLFTAIVSKGSLLLMTNAVGHVETVCLFLYINFFLLAIPYSIMLLLLLYNISFKKSAQNPYKERWVWMLIVTICAPYLFTFFDSIFKSLFGNKPWPTLKILFFVSFSLCVLYFSQSS